MELEFLAKQAAHPVNVQTIFFGGGTPSLLPTMEIDYIFQVLHEHFKLSRNVEITLEANPGMLSRSYLMDLKVMGVNRLSLGMQSSIPGELNVLERQHNYIDVIQSVNWARQAGIDNINLDLLFGIPYQSVHDWELSLMRAVGLTPDHLSLYALTLENGTPMQNWVARGLISEPNSDLAAEMYTWASKYLRSKRYLQYEISNWVGKNDGKDEKTCAHNLQYWRNKPYLGVGAGAHGFAGATRVKNISSPPIYIKKLVNLLPPAIKSGSFTFPQTPASTHVQSINKKTEMSETMMMGLRLTQEGVSLREFESRFDLSLIDVYGDEINRLTSLGLIEWVGDEPSIRLTPRGRLLGNQVFMEFV
jgi:oxygen-independent coproporphyrinogen-3 oxidase